MTKAALADLRKRVRDARDVAIKADNAARDAKEKARALAEKRVALESELDLEEWAAAQEGLGVDPDDIDRDNRVVRSHPEGPTYDEAGG